MYDMSYNVRKRGIMRYTILKTENFNDWYNEETIKSQTQIDDRLWKIEDCGYFGVINDVGDDVSELKWKNGRRIYYVVIPDRNVLLLLGGNKNGQDYDIKKAKKIFRKYVEET
jgi:putative addiction module killer protein